MGDKNAGGGGSNAEEKKPAFYSSPEAGPTLIYWTDDGSQWWKSDVKGNEKLSWEDVISDSKKKKYNDLFEIIKCDPWKTKFFYFPSNYKLTGKNVIITPGEKVPVTTEGMRRYKVS